MSANRAAGLLLHPTSLPGRFGVGDFGPEADAFLDWAVLAGQKIWQVMPLGPTGFHDSPYSCLSAFAGNPFLISPQLLHEEGLLPPGALKDVPVFPADRVDFARVIPWKDQLLRTSLSHFLKVNPPAIALAFEEFVAAPQQTSWLPDWALFSALKEKFAGKEWDAWGAALGAREPTALAAARRELRAEIRFHEYVQFLFFRQWERLKKEAVRRGLLVMGDLPIYMAFGSADVWAHQHLFTLAKDGVPTAVAGVPPDYFSETGQLWGNPLYRWDEMEADGYAWWIERMRQNFRLADLVRIDHFRGFASYWEVPAGEPTALNGRWVPGPGAKLFDAIRAALGDLTIVAEDLGVITEEVTLLRQQLGFPGMSVLQFAFGELDSLYLPHNLVPGTVVYTGTHDNDTTRGWFSHVNAEDRRRVLGYLGTDGETIEWDLIRAAYTSAAERAIVPVQDVFGLGSAGRMNTPGTAEGNWSWRAAKDRFDAERAGGLRWLAELTGRR
ncbi:MAG: 4-alpha-glucanotransferase [Thermoanaerobaculia bacterium]